MTAKVIVITNQKGGCGKTTLTMQLAGLFSEKGQRVLVVDADPQGSSLRWSSSAPEKAVFPADVMSLSTAGKKIHQEVKKFMKNYDWIFIDCPPAVDSLAPQSALLIADLALVPIIPSPPDLWAGIGIKELIERVKGLNEDLQVRLVPNMCQRNVRLSKEAIEVLNEFELPIAKSKLTLKTAYRQAAAVGGTVSRLGPSGKSALKEVEALRKEILSILEVEEVAKKPVLQKKDKFEEAVA